MDPKRLVFAAAMVLVTGCSHQFVWTKTGATQNDFDADRRACLNEAGSGASSQQAYNSCMMAHGYNQNATAPAAHPDDAKTEPTSEMPGSVQFAELLPTGMLQAAMMPPASVMTEPAKPVAMAPTGPVYGGHLASYFREADALRGWNIIVGQQSSIGSLKRHIVPIQTAKGPMVRLIAGDFANNEEATRFCTWARQQRLYCAVMTLGADDKISTPVPASTARPRAPRRPANRG